MSDIKDTNLYSLLQDSTIIVSQILQLKRYEIPNIGETPQPPNPSPSKASKRPDLGHRRAMV